MLDSVRKVADGIGKVSDSVRKVSYGIKKSSDDARKVSDGVRKCPEYILKDSWQEAYVEHTEIKDLHVAIVFGPICGPRVQVG